MTLNGYFKFHRAMLDHPVWRLPLGQLKVWLTCLALANYKPGEWWDGRQRVEIPPGSFITSQPHLATAAGVSRIVVRHAISNLVALDSIRAKVQAKRWTLIEIVNWPLYQGDDEQLSQEKSPRRAKGEPSVSHNGRREEERGRVPRPQKPSDAAHGHTGKGNGKVPAGYQEAVDHWFLEFERTRGGKPQFDQAEGASLKQLLGAHPVDEVKAIMTHILTRTQLKHIRERHAYTLHSLVGSWNELWSEYRRRAAEEGEG